MLTDSLYSSLSKIWNPPDFFLFFKKYSKRPPHIIKKRTVLFNTGGPLAGVYFIQKGFIKLYRLSEDGKESVIYLTGPGDLLGLRALISENQVAYHFAEALTEAEIYLMTREEFFHLLSEKPGYIINLIHAFVKRLNHAEQRLEGFINADATGRVAVFLFDIAERFGRKRGERIILPLELTHQRISEFVGSVRETATLAMEELKKAKVLDSKRGQITIVDINKLQQFAKISPD